MMWQVTFYSNAQILSRYLDATERNAEYTTQVTDAFKAGKPTAIVDYYNSEIFNPDVPGTGIKPSKVIGFGKQFRIYMYPDKKILEGLHFDMH
jgi:hypothetical protein